MAEPEVWGGEGLSVGELVCLMEEASSAAGAERGGLQALGDDQVHGNDDQVVEEEAGKLLDFEALWLESGWAFGPFPW